MHAERSKCNIQLKVAMTKITPTLTTDACSFYKRGKPWAFENKVRWSKDEKLKKKKDIKSWNHSQLEGGQFFYE